MRPMESDDEHEDARVKRGPFWREETIESMEDSDEERKEVVSGGADGDAALDARQAGIRECMINPQWSLRWDLR